MLHIVDLVIIGVSVGLGVGILIATLVFLCIRCYRRHSHLPRSAHDSPPSALPTTNTRFVDTSIIVSESFTNSVTVKLSTHPAKTSPLAILYNNSKDRLASVSGLLEYSYKYVSFFRFICYYF